MVRWPAASRHLATVVAAAAYACWILPGANSSFVPRPLADFALSGTGRRFGHRERYSFADGADVALNWEVEHPEPASILALDVEQSRGVRLLECSPNRLILRVPGAHASQAAAWRHVTASHFLHSCSHLRPGSNLYHRVTQLRRMTPLEVASSAAPGEHEVELLTEELTSPAEIFPFCRFSFDFMPAEAKEVLHLPATELPKDEEPSAIARRLSLSYNKDSKPIFSSSFTPEKTEVGSILNLDVPKQMSNISWNWDYDANATRNPEFMYRFPGGKGWIRLYRPYLKAHFGIRVNFTSHMKGLKTPPHVKVLGELQGFADLNADIATAIDFETDRSASVLDNILDVINIPNLTSDIPGLPNITSENMFVNPLHFYLGSIPLTIQPGFNCKLKAYHTGLLKGSLRVGLATRMVLKGLMNFDTAEGLQTNFSAKALNVSITPPTWMLFTNHFELGVMLEPEVSVKGGFGAMQDMGMGFGLRPYLNVSIMQANAKPGDPEYKQLAVYPFRVTGLPTGQSYSLRIIANGHVRQTSSQFSTGVHVGMVEYDDDLDNFEFGMATQESLKDEPIQVDLIDQSGQVVASGEATCTKIVDGLCQPSPLIAKMQVANRDVFAEMTAVWDIAAINLLKSKVRSVSMSFPTVTVDEGISKVLDRDPQMLQDAQLRLLRNGHAYSVPLASKMNSTMLLRGRIIYELGPSFLGNWKFPAQAPDSLAAARAAIAHGQAAPSSTTLAEDASGQGSLGKFLTPFIELVVGGEVVGIGSLPPSVAWDNKAQSSNSGLGAFTDQLASMQALPAMVPLYSPINSSAMVGTAQTMVNVLEPSGSAFWVSPSQAEDIVGGQEHSFAWTVHGGKENTQYEFMLTAMGIGRTGELIPTEWKHSVKTVCSFNTGLDVGRYTGGVDMCVFQHKVAIPASLNGHSLAMVIGWLDAIEQRHEMISAAFRLVETAPSGLMMPSSQGSRNTLDHGEAWSSKSLGSTEKTVMAPKVKARLDRLREKACGREPLQYSLGAGINFVEHMRNMAMNPFGMPMIGDDNAQSQSPHFTSEPIPIFRLGGMGNNGTKLSDVLPKSMCAGGVCEGMMPGCQNTKVNPINIKQIVFKLSRLFKWKHHFGPKMRHAVAYALALFPSALEVGDRQIKANLANGGDSSELARRMVKPLEEGFGEAMPYGLSAAFSPDAAVASSRRLSQDKASLDDDGDVDEEDKTEFDMFTVKIKEPIHYDITDGLIRTLIHRNAFRIEDGREEELGPIFIQDFELRDPQASSLAARHVSHTTPVEATKERIVVPAAVGPRVGLLGTSVVGVAALFLGAVTVLGAIILSFRRRGYTLLGESRQPPPLPAGPCVETQDLA